MNRLFALAVKLALFSGSLLNADAVLRTYGPMRADLHERCARFLPLTALTASSSIPPGGSAGKVESECNDIGRWRSDHGLFCGLHHPPQCRQRRDESRRLTQKWSTRVSEFPFDVQPQYLACDEEMGV